MIHELKMQNHLGSNWTDLSTYVQQYKEFQANQKEILQQVQNE